jgi:hypothetical protein
LWPSTFPALWQNEEVELRNYKWKWRHGTKEYTKKELAWNMERKGRKWPKTKLVIEN